MTRATSSRACVAATPKRWNIYWITAHFLTAAADFEKLGVDWKSF